MDELKKEFMEKFATYEYQGRREIGGSFSVAGEPAEEVWDWIQNHFMPSKSTSNDYLKKWQDKTFPKK